MFMSLASATLTLTEVSIPSTADHNSQVTVTFNLTADQAYTNLDWSKSIDPSKGSWTTLPTLTSIDNETLTLTAVFTIDKYASGTINDAEIVVNDTDTSDTGSLPFLSITINEDKSLSISDKTIPKGEDSVNITIKNTGNTLLPGIELTTSGDFEVSFSNNDFTLITEEERSIEVTITDLSDLKTGDNEITITATSGSTSATGKITTEKSFCDCENPGKLDIKIDDVTVEGFGDDDDYWYLFDEIEVKIKVENDGDWDIEDIEIEWELYLTNGEKIMDGDESDFNLDEGDEETIIISFKLDEDLDEFEGEDVIFYIKATGTIDDNDADDNDGDETCDWDSKEIEVRTDENFVILDDFQFSELISCGSDVQITADVWNIMDSDQDDVYVMVYNKELNINEKVEIGDIDSFDKESFFFEFQVPEDAEEKSYPLKFTVYDEDDDIYENDEDKQAEFFVSLKIEGNCLLNTKPLVSAILESGGQAGKELIIKATITNTGDILATYTLNSEGYDSWSSLESITPSSIIVESGKSKEVLFTYKVNKDASGAKVFNIEVLSGDESLVKQPVSITIEESNGFGFLTGGVISGDNWYLWGIGALNLVLVLVIIFVALKVMRNKE